MCLLQYWIIKLFLWRNLFFLIGVIWYVCLVTLYMKKYIRTFRYFILVTIWKIDFLKIHIAHFGILYLLQYEKSIFSMSRFFCPLHSMVYFYFIVAKIWKKNLSNVPSCNSITMILLYLLQYYFLYFIVVSKRNKQLQVDTIANIELPLN